jgi:alpha,alpha-trehalase
MKKLFFISFFALLIFQLRAQIVQTPDQLYGDLFKDVQLSAIFPDGKTFVDCVPKRNPKDIVKDYLAVKNNPAVRFSLKLFVEANFEMPPAPPAFNYIQQEKDVTMHIKNLWSVLKRDADKATEGSSLLALPYPYIVPGGRFREIYYWDSYFTMLGLKESGEYGIIENMIDNFSWLIMNYGHIPNGNRTYYVSRSQPPFFSLMVELLASIKGDSIYTKYLPALEKEFLYWWEYETGGGEYNTSKHYLASNHIRIFRYYDGQGIPRQESYNEDSLLMKSVLAVDLRKMKYDDIIWFRLNQNKLSGQLYRHLRSAAESGWDFSSRWFADSKNIKTIETTDFSPVDLNCLVYNLEKVLAKAYQLKGDSKKQSYYDQLAKELAEKGINYYCWGYKEGWFVDYNAGRDKRWTAYTLAGMYPLFMKVATKEQAARAVEFLKKNFIKPGGVVTSLLTTGQQWDAPNGWAPLQWITIIGLENYGYHELAKSIAKRWIKLNNDVYQRTGKLMEKYNVVNTHLDAGGGEYNGQDGFGWTNGVLLALISKYGKP